LCLQVLVFGTLFVVAMARPQNADDITIVRSENENAGDGTFSWVSELSDGTTHQQNGYIKQGDDPENPIQVIEGSYAYYAPEGEYISVRYIADENGFQPEGDHLPVAPPIPEAIQKGLDLIYANIQDSKKK